MSTTPAFAPGSINAFFENTLSKYGAKYGIQTHSRDPWLLSLNGFLSETETKALLSVNACSVTNIKIYMNVFACVVFNCY